MAQKVNPLVLRIKQNIKSTTFHQQAYNKKYLPYIINEQEKIYNFLILFFQQLGLKIHSFSMIKDQKGYLFYCVKFVFMKGIKRKKFQKTALKFHGLENALCVGLGKLASKRPLNLLVYEITTKLKSRKNLPKVFQGYKFFSFLELTKTAQIIKSTKGVGRIFADVLCEKVENLRTKTDKKLQGRLFVFIEKLLYFLRNFTRSTIKGLKIEIKGRVNGAARSKKTNIFLVLLGFNKWMQKLIFSINKP